MDPIVRTIFGAHLQTLLSLRRPFTVLPNSTLNQRFSLFNEEVPGAQEYPVIGFVGIGNKGRSYEVTGNGMVLTDPLMHWVDDAGLFNFIPFVMRRVSDDLTPGERLKYRMRVPVTIGGVPYVAYYLRALPLASITPKVEKRTVLNGVITSEEFTPSVGKLTPTEANSQISNTAANLADGDYLVSTAPVSLKLTEEDIKEILDACELLYGDRRFANISELVLVSGIDRVLPGTFGNTTSNYTEVIAAQANAYVAMDHTLSDYSTELTFDFELGSGEPMPISSEILV